MALSTPRVSLADRLTVSYRHPARRWVVLIPAAVILLLLVQALLPDTALRSQTIGRLMLVVLALWVVIVGYSYNAWVSIASPFIALMVAEIWVIVSTVRAQVVYGAEFSTYDFSNLFFVYVLYYLAGSVLGYLAPNGVRLIRFGLLAVFTISSLVAIAQAAGIRAAINLAHYYQYQSNQDITNWDGRSGTRAIGLSPTPAIMGLEAGFALALAFSPYFFRKLKWWEIGLSLLFLAAAAASQSRGTYVILGIFGIAAAFATIAKYGLRGLVSVVITMLALAGVLYLNLKRLSYALGFDATYFDNVKYRQQNSWQGGLRAFQYSQLFGIGPEPFVTGGPNHLITRFNTQSAVDNGYIALLAMYGIPGMFLFVASPILGIISGLRATIDRNLDDEDRAVALSLVAVAALLLCIMGVNSGWIYVQLWTLLSLFAGTFVGSIRAKKMKVMVDRVASTPKAV